jgi:hypothetical protein
LFCFTEPPWFDFNRPGSYEAALHSRDAELAKERFSATNLDKEDLKEALVRLVSAATKNGGTLFIQ